ncbi:alpha/beta-hydrolase [Cylindrobasidium torrendii FP15055 ss-10]|uniref:Carboxylic ester hydrolase n=1 Tax=Cylindrobasidium torrendii FP15055 ss-10 TaxID=1314674 RepID=A0A0D7B2P0_9AGAR|nr:alpha/beta-hydrolase [Cylindrobasidium torrendii FP15055 ss-10]
MLRLVALLSLLLPVVFAQISNAPVVDLGYATYRGAYTGNLTRFEGIRYAAPPIGDLRWRAPQALQRASNAAQNAPNTVQDATSIPAQCPQSGTLVSRSATNPFLDSQGGWTSSKQPRADTALVSSEDCLYLSVYTPGFVNPSLKLPVVFWIHGGGYAFGSSDLDSSYDLVPESNGQVIVVSVQYRLGLFGFLASQSVKDSGDLNAGLLDQRLALQWTQEHISKFGGDPNQVTIWGFSAGAGSVLQHIIADGGHTDPPLFKRAMTSSTYLPPQYAFNDAVPQFWYNQVIEGAGCAWVEDDLNCLRKADTLVLQSLNKLLFESSFSGTYSFVPVVDGELIQQSPTAALINRNVNGEGLLAVVNTNEGNLFINPGIPASYDAAEYLHQFFPLLSEDNIRKAARIYAALVGDHSARGNLTQVAAIATDSIFVCPSYFALQAFGNLGYKAEFAVPPAFHGGDMAYYFPSKAVPPVYTNAEFSAAYSGSFISFALSGSPVQASLPEWPVFGSGHNEMLFNATEAGDPVFKVIQRDDAQLERCEFWKQVRNETGQ